MSDELTARERDVLRAFAEGVSQRETAARLGVGLSTVKRCVVSARLKLGATTTTQAVAIAVRRGLLLQG